MQGRRCTWTTRPNGEGACTVSLHGDVDPRVARQLGDELLDLAAAGAGDMRVVGASPHVRLLLEPTSLDVAVAP